MADKPAESKPGIVEAPAAAAPSGGAKAWVPLIITVLLMPVLAFVMTKFVLIPKVVKAREPQTASAAASTGEGEKGSKGEGEKGEKGEKGGKGKITVPLSKILVNVAGTMGTRYLMTSVTLVSNSPDFKSKVDDNKDQLMDLATSTLSGKTISDLEKPGARNVIRAELTTVFNNALGGPIVQEIYITELAIQ